MSICNAFSLHSTYPKIGFCRRLIDPGDVLLLVDAEHCQCEDREFPISQFEGVVTGFVEVDNYCHSCHQGPAISFSLVRTFVIDKVGG